MRNESQFFVQLTQSAELFGKAFFPALGLAIACVAVQAFLVPRAPFNLFTIYLHVWFVLTMTGWLLRERSGVNPLYRIAGRTAASAGIVTATLVIALWAGSAALANVAATTGQSAYWNGFLTYNEYSGWSVMGRQVWSAIWIPIWTIAILLDLPARIVAGHNKRKEPLGPTLIRRAVAIAPWLVLVAVLGWPSQVCEGECWGMFEGGIVMMPIFGAYLFTLSLSCAAISAASRTPPKSNEPEVYIPPQAPMTQFRK